MGGGKGGGGGEIPQEVEDTARILRDIGVEQFDLGFPLMQMGGEQAMDVLGTGRTDALMPAIRTATERARSQQGQGLQQLHETLAKRGITGTAAQEALAKGRIGAESVAAAVPSQFTLPFLQGMGGPAFGLTEQGMQGIAKAGQIGGMAAGPARSGGGAGKGIGSALGSIAGGVVGTMVAPGAGTALGAQLGGAAGGGIGSSFG